MSGAPGRPVVGRMLLLTLGALLVAAHALLAALPDLLRRTPTLLIAIAGLVALMMAAWLAVRRGGAAAVRLAIGFAVAARLVAALGPPVLSDDVYRYVWDGRVSLHGVHPYRHPPDDPRLAGLRDEEVWPRVNHRDVPTIYPPLAQALFAGLAAVGAGPTGFKLVMAGLDVGVVLVLHALLGALGMPRHRVVLYAWSPLAVLETAGSGHLEPAGVLCVLVAVLALERGRHVGAAVATGAAVLVKVLPLVLLPGLVRRLRTSAVLAGAVLLALPLLSLVRGAPVLPPGAFEYARRWEHNAPVFPVVRRALERIDAPSAAARAIGWAQGTLPPHVLPWGWLHRHAWPEEIARLVVAALATAWVLVLAFRRRLGFARQVMLALGGVLVLSPTVHPWYLLWVLPFAAALASAPWLTMAALVPLAYTGGDGDVPASVRIVEYGVPLLVAGACAMLRARARRARPLRPPGAP